MRFVWDACECCGDGKNRLKLENIHRTLMFDLKSRYCLNCGRPLTEEAWEELERRIAAPPPPNEPLTLVELWEMDGEPVWVEYPGRWSGWHLVKLSLEVCTTVYLWTSKGYSTFAEAAFAAGAIVYRRKPEEGTTCV